MFEIIDEKGNRLKDALTVNYLFYSGHIKIEKEQSEFSSRHFITMLFCESGSFSLRYVGQNLTVPENCLVFIPPQTFYEVIPEKGKARLFRCEFSLVSRVAIDVFDRFYFSNGITLPMLKKLAKCSLEIFPNGNALEEVENPNPLCEHLVKSTLEFIIIECINSTDKSIIDKFYPISGKGESAKVALSVYEYLSKNTHRNITLEEIADELFFSVSYVKTCFKKHTGKTIIQAFLELKIEKAKKLIRKGENSSAIASLLAFSSPQYFSKTFTKIVGITPSQYEKSLIK